MGRKVGVTLSYVLMILEVFSTLLLTPFIIRTLGQAEYGVYKLSASIAAYLLLLDLGVGNAIVRYVSKYRATGDRLQESRFFGVALIYYSIIALITAICGGFLVAFFPRFFSIGLTSAEIALGQKLLALSTLNAVVTLATSVFSSVLIGYGYFSVSRGVSIIQIVIRMITTYIALHLGLKSIAIVSIHLALTILGRSFFALYVFFKLKLRPKFSGITKSFINDIFGYSTLILLQMIATQINSMSGQILLGVMVPGAAVIIAVFGTGTQVTQYFQSIGNAFSSVLMPGVVQLVERGASPTQLQSEMVRIGRITLLVLAAILGGFAVFGQQFIALWAGPEYHDAYYVALLVMFAQMFILTQTIGNQMLWAKNAHKEQAILKVAIVIANVAVTMLLISWNPLLGTAIGTFISLLLGDILLMNLIFKKKLGIKLRSYYKELFRGILPVTLLSMALAFLFSFVALRGWFGFFINVCVYCVVYGVLTILFALNPYEKNLIFGIFKKVLRK